MHYRPALLATFLGFVSLRTCWAEIWYPHIEHCPRNAPEPALPTPAHTPRKVANALGITGDVLNVTRCYCTDRKNNPLEAPIIVSEKFGYVMEMEYWNYHTERKYKTSWKCLNDTELKGNVPYCWDTYAREGVKVCDEHDGENKFCYHIKFDRTDYWNVASEAAVAADTIHFNKQSRSHARLGPSSSPRPDVCNSLCYWYLGEDMIPARDDVEDNPVMGDGQTWSKRIFLPHEPGMIEKDRRKWQSATLCSRKQVWTQIDDMCHGCA